MRTPKYLTHHAREMRKEPTDAERKLHQALRDRRLEGFKFRRQYVLEGFILDHYCVELKLCVELDGGQHHDGGQNERRDQRRDERLRSLGVTVVRIEDHELLTNFNGALRLIYDTAIALAARPSP